jgi:hypothetical protein
MTDTGMIGAIPYRLALAGGWIDQPFMSRLNPDPCGAMVVVGLQPVNFYMERCGMATGTRNIARSLWQDELPQRPAADLVRELYAAENQGQKDPSGSQDMIGLIHPGINRLDYDFRVEGGVFPAHIESCRDPLTAAWLESVLHLLPVMQRPAGYSPLGIQQLDPAWVRRLGQSGKDCYDAILARDLRGLGATFNECMACWEALLPQTVRHPAINIDLIGLLRNYQARYPGAMYSGCGGGYLFVLSEEPVPGSFQVKIRI